MAIFWPTPGFNWRTFELWSLNSTSAVPHCGRLLTQVLSYTLDCKLWHNHFSWEWWMVCGLSLADEDFGEKVRRSILRLHSFYSWRSARAHKFHSLGFDQSTMAQRAKTTVAECLLTCDLVPWQVPALCLDNKDSPLRLRWVKGVSVFWCNLPFAPLA